MKRTFICIAFLLIPVFTIFAQKDFRPGFVVTTQNDTIRGEIDYRSNSKNYELCRFKQGDNITEYAPQQLLGYQYIDDKYFTSQVLDGLFVEVLVEGELSLYKYTSVFYIQKLGDELYKLETKEVKLIVDGKVNVKDDTKWKGIVSYLISDCLHDQHELAALSLDEGRLTRIVKKYNSCKGHDYAAYKESKAWTRIEWGATVGVIKSTLEQKSANYLGTEYTSIAPSMGITMGVTSPRITEKIAFQLEVLFTKATYTDFLKLERTFNTEYHDAVINITTLSIPLAFRYSFPERKYGIQLFAGGTYDYMLNSSSHRISEKVEDDVVKTYESSVYRFKPSQIGYWGGMNFLRSLEKFRVGLGVRYYHMIDLAKPLDLGLHNDKLSVSIILQKK